MKNKFVKIASVVLSTAIVTSLSACGGGSGNGVKLDFVYGGTTEYLIVMRKVLEAYNDGQGKTDKITVRMQPVSEAGLSTQVDAALSDPNGADVVMLNDSFFKPSARKGLMDLKNLFSEDLLSDMYSTHLQRYYYNINTQTSNPSDPLLGLPLNNDSTVLYYNKTALEALNIKCISVSEDELDEFNNGGKDHNGKTKKDYGIPDSFKVPAKGFYRENSYVYGDDYIEYNADELMIFNDRIATSWDEIEDVGQLSSKFYNTASTTQYGYFTEWWFNYGWSVGGDCLVDMSGNGDFAYSHPDGNPNYIVTEGTYTGKYTGTVYQEGETLDFKDVICDDPSDVVGYETDDTATGIGTYFYWTVNGERSEVIADVTTAKNAGTLSELPSINYALTRYCEISSGNKIMPKASTVSNSGGTIKYFTNKLLAFCIEYSSNFKQIDRDAKFEWGIAPLPVYKEYVSADSDELKVAGKQSNHSLGYCVSINANTKLQDQAVTFINWLVDEGQKILAENSFMTSRISQKDLLVEKFQYGNEYAYIQSLNYSLAGDWWYMPDRGWIDVWASPLNNSVRNGAMSVEEFLYGYIIETNDRLADYKK